MLLATIVLALSSSCCSSYAEDSFPLIKKENQQAIINSLSHSLCEMAQASIPIGGYTETSWAASEVQKLHQEVTTKKRPFLQQMSAIYEMKVGIMKMITEGMIQIAVKEQSQS